MNSLFRHAVFLLGLFLVPVFAFTQEFGFDATTSLGASRTANSSLNTGFRVDGWWKVPLGTSGSLFDGSAHTGFTLSGSVGDVEKALLYDIDRIRLLFVIPSPGNDVKSLHIEFGRLSFQDATGLIVSHPADGAKLGAVFPLLKFNLQAGYTGLLMKSNNSISLSLFDEQLLADDSSFFGTSRILVAGELSIPKVFNQSVALSFVAQQDLNPADKLIPEWTINPYTEMVPRGGRFNSQYTTLNLSGALSADLFYSSWFTLGSGRTLSWLEDQNSATGFSYQYVQIQSVMTGFTLNYYRQELFHSAFNIRFLYASGDQDYSAVTEGNTGGNSTMFVPVTSAPFGLVFSPALSNLMIAEFGGSIKPIPEKNLQTGLRLFAFFRPTSGPVAASGLKAGENSSLLGYEADMYGNFRLYSDLGMSLNTGLFFPVSSPLGAFNKEDAGVQYSIQFALTLGL